MSTRSDIARSITGNFRELSDTPLYPVDPPPSFERGGEALNKSLVELLGIFDNREVKERAHVSFSYAIDQAYILINWDWYHERADLMLTGRTLVGASLPDERRQVNRGTDSGDRVASYKMRSKGKLAYLFHEKPFEGIGGSGISVNLFPYLEQCGWLLRPDARYHSSLCPLSPQDIKLLFLTFVVTVAYAVHRHGDLLCAAAASAGNEYRLGADKRDPPAVMSLSLGAELTKIFAAIESGGKGKKRDFADIDADIPPDVKYYGDSTAPVAINGSSFTFRMPGVSTNLPTFITVVNTILADSMAAICERIKKESAKQQDKDTAAAVMNVIAAVIKESKSVLFEGDVYSSEWVKEARTRGLPSAVPAHEALKAFTAPKSVELFKRRAIFSEAELKEMYEARLNQYCKTLDVEVKTLADIVNTQVLPAAYNYQADIASGLEVLRVLADDMTIEMTDGALEDRKEMFEKLTADIYCLRKSLKELTAAADKARGMGLPERAAYLFKEIKPKIGGVRRYVDALEGSMPDESWPLPKYKEMLFIL
ncbi:glutamine synthetase [Fibrobacteres bacterium R8-0-B4]